MRLKCRPWRDSSMKLPFVNSYLAMPLLHINTLFIYHTVFHRGFQCAPISSKKNFLEVSKNIL